MLSLAAPHSNQSAHSRSTASRGHRWATGVAIKIPFSGTSTQMRAYPVTIVPFLVYIMLLSEPHTLLPTNAMKCDLCVSTIDIDIEVTDSRVFVDRAQCHILIVNGGLSLESLPCPAMPLGAQPSQLHPVLITSQDTDVP